MESQEENNNSVVDYRSISADDVDQKYIICACGETFASEDTLSVHLIKQENNCGIDAANVCVLCSKVFDNLHSLSIHRKREHLTLEPAGHGYVMPNYLFCTECGKEFLHKYSLAAHMRTHNGERPYKCKFCTKRFTQHTALSIHRRMHTGERPFLCSTCGKTFACCNAFTRHMRVHTGVKPYDCAICCKRFSQSNSCKLHYRTVHLKQPQPYKSQSKLQTTRRQQTVDDYAQDAFEENAVGQDK